MPCRRSSRWPCKSVTVTVFVVHTGSGQVVAPTGQGCASQVSELSSAPSALANDSESAMNEPEACVPTSALSRLSMAVLARSALATPALSSSPLEEPAQAVSDHAPAATTNVITLNRVMMCSSSHRASGMGLCKSTRS